MSKPTYDNEARGGMTGWNESDNDRDYSSFNERAGYESSPSPPLLYQPSSRPLKLSKKSSSTSSLSFPSKTQTLNHKHVHRSDSNLYDGTFSRPSASQTLPVEFVDSDDSDDGLRSPVFSLGRVDTKGKGVMRQKSQSRDLLGPSQNGNKKTTKLQNDSAGGVICIGDPVPESKRTLSSASRETLSSLSTKTLDPFLPQRRIKKPSPSRLTPRIASPDYIRDIRNYDPTATTVDYLLPKMQRKRFRPGQEPAGTESGDFSRPKASSSSLANPILLSDDDDYIPPPPTDVIDLTSPHPKAKTSSQRTNSKISSSRRGADDPPTSLWGEFDDEGSRTSQKSTSSRRSGTSTSNLSRHQRDGEIEEERDRHAIAAAAQVLGIYSDSARERMNAAASSQSSSGRDRNESSSSQSTSRRDRTNATRVSTSRGSASSAGGKKSKRPPETSAERTSFMPHRLGGQPLADVPTRTVSANQPPIRPSSDVMTDEQLARMLQEEEYSSLQPPDIDSTFANLRYQDISSVPSSHAHNRGLMGINGNPLSSLIRHDRDHGSRRGRATRNHDISEADMNLIAALELADQLGASRGIGRRDEAYYQMIPQLMRQDMAAQPGNYLNDDELDTSYEALLALSERIGNALPNGIPAETISQLPTMRFKSGTLKGEEAKCTVCLTDYEPGDKLKGTPCAHWFHDECVDRWLKDHRTCPICRTNIQTQ